jgi:Arc/MetJ-type ribon-helix-helix transcriptional regulator
MATVTKSVKLPEELARQLEAQAHHQGTSESELIREGITRVIRDAGGLDMRALIESDLGIGSGPVDLSGNRRHREGYGRSRHR